MSGFTLPRIPRQARQPPAPKTACPCGGRYSLRIIVEYTIDGHIESTGGRFCYVSDAAIELQIPDDATPVRALIYDLHEPDEIIRITFTRKAP